MEDGLLRLGVVAGDLVMHELHARRNHQPVVGEPGVRGERNPFLLRIDAEDFVVQHRNARFAEPPVSEGEAVDAARSA